jgi:hypothetical protein
MFKMLYCLLLFGLQAFTFSPLAMAQHGGHSHSGGTVPSQPLEKSREMSTKGTSAQFVTVQGLRISLEVMEMGEHMKHTARGASHSDADHARSHSLMVNLQDLASKEIISDARVAYTLSAPSGKKETGKLAWSGDHYSAAADLKEKGTYRVRLAIESGGMERQADFKYRPK